MTAVECLSNIINDCHALDNEALNRMDAAAADTEVSAVVTRWLGWIESVGKKAGLPEAELHSAFMFTCDGCGRDTFVRGVEVRQADDCVFIVPATETVKCEHCNVEYEPEVVHPYDFSQDMDDDDD